MKLRTPTAADVPAISRLAREVFAQTYGSNLSAEVLQAHLETHLSSQIFESEINQGNLHFMVAEAEGSLVGLVKLEVDIAATPPTVELVNLYVASSFHGSGVASALMESSLEWAKNQGCASMWLVVWEDNPRAVRFYQKQGFAVVGKETVWVGPTAFNDLKMERSLQ